MKKTINLLPEKKKNFFDIIIYFVLHYFRYIVVITQIVVISVFFYRFYVDQRILDQKELYKQKQRILAITYPLVVEAKSLEQTTNQIRAIVGQQNHFDQYYQLVMKSVPEDITLNLVTISETSVQLSGKSLSAQSIVNFRAKLEASNKFTLVVIMKVDRNKDNTFNFQINGQNK